MAFLMVTWGILSMAMALINGPISFSILRFLVGAAEAGFFPGMIFYIACWFPADYRARISSIFMLSIPLSNFAGSAVSGAVMEISTGGLSAWQWLFITEGFPSVLLGVCFLWLMADRPEDVTWLSAGQKRALRTEFDAEEKGKATTERQPILKVMCDKRVMALSLTYCGMLSVSVSLSLWQPQLIKAFGLTNFQTGLLSSIPFALSAVAMVWWGRHSDRGNERLWHTAIPMLLTIVALLATFINSSLAVMVLLLSLMQIGSQSAKGPLWALTTQWMSARNVGGALAVISAIGSLATALTTYLFGVIREQTGSYELALLPLVAFSVLGIPVLFMVKSHRSEENLELAPENRTKC